jgi:hypothetical protein
MAAGFCARRWISERAQLSVAAIAGQGRVARATMSCRVVVSEAQKAGWLATQRQLEGQVQGWNWCARSGKPGQQANWRHAKRSPFGGRGEAWAGDAAAVPTGDEREREMVRRVVGRRFEDGPALERC